MFLEKAMFDVGINIKPKDKDGKPLKPSKETIAAAAANTLLDVGDLCTTLSAIGICNSDCET